MIHIPLDGNSPDATWLADAAAVTTELMAATTEEDRKKIINGNSEIWTRLRDWLLRLSHGKCWYSESREIVSLYDVDHFRPKNSALNLNGSKRSGYWWLAFDWTNYRIAGTIPNRSFDGRGKRDYFPLRDGSTAASNPGDNITLEVPYFLDPVDRDDPVLLSFDESGNPVPAVPDGGWEAERVRITVYYYYLDYRPLVDARKVIWNECNRLMARAVVIMKEIAARNYLNEQELREIFLQLRHKTSDDAELSSTASACLRKSNHIWAANLIERR